MPVRAVWHVPGSKASEASSILILGGQGMDEPDMLYLLPVEPSDPKEVRSPSDIRMTCFTGLAQGLVSNARLPSSSVCSRIHPFCIADIMCSMTRSQGSHALPFPHGMPGRHVIFELWSCTPMA